MYIVDTPWFEMKMTTNILNTQGKEPFGRVGLGWAVELKLFIHSQSFGMDK